MQQLLRYKATYSLATLIALFYLYSILHSGSVIDIPAQSLVAIGAVYAPIVVIDGEWYRIVLSMFLHGSLTHVALNAISLILVGSVVEQYLYKSQYLSIYFLSGIVGALASIYFHPINVLIGASGAIFGIFGALVGFFIANRQVMMGEFKAVMQNIGVMLLINLGIGIVFPSIDMVAHIAGFCFGILSGYLASRHLILFWGYILLAIIGIVAFAHYLPTIYMENLISVQ